MLSMTLCAATAVGDDHDAALRSVTAKIESAIEDGRFEFAQRTIAQAQSAGDESTMDVLAVQSEIMRRIRYDYSLDRDAVLAKLKRSIPDVTAADVDRWREQGVLQHRVIDGETYYFRREPSNLFRFCPEARKRAGINPTQKDAETDQVRFSLADHVAGLIKEAAESDGPMIRPIHHRVRYAMTVPPDHPRVRKGALVRCWLPFPQEYRQQSGVRLVGKSLGFKEVAPSGSPHRTAYFEQTVQTDGQSLEYWIEVEFVTAAYCPDLTDPSKKIDKAAETLANEFIQPREPHIPFNDEVKSLAKEIVGDASNPLERARRIFCWIATNIQYCSEMEYSTIPSLTRKALDSRKGDCGVQAMSFITLCRAAGIPARWQSGWESLPGRENMHDWAEFYVAPWGWLPADPSYGLLNHDDPNVREFYFGHLDSYRMIVNLGFARPLDPPKHSFRSEPNDFQRGEIEIDGVNLYFDEWDCAFDVTTEAVADSSGDPSTDIPGMHRRIKSIARTIWPEGDLPIERAAWFCKLFARLAISNHSLVYLDANVRIDGERVVLDGATNVAHLRTLLASALSEVGVGEVVTRISALPDRDRLGDRLYGACVASRALTWQRPYNPDAAQSDAEKPGEQTELLFGEPVFLLDRRDGCYLLHGSDGYWGWVNEKAIAPMNAEQFDRYRQAGRRAVVTRDVSIEGVTVPRGAIVRIDSSSPDAMHIIHPAGRELGAPQDAIRFHDAGQAGGDRLLEAARTFLNTPYAFGGRSPDGIDCSGLVSNVYGQFDVRVARDAWQQALDGELIATAWHRDGIRTGDQLFLIDLSGKIYHTGIAVDQETVLHAAPPAVRINSLDSDDPAYEHRFIRDFFMAKRRALDNEL